MAVSDLLLYCHSEATSQNPLTTLACTRQTVTIDATSDGTPLSLTIESPSGNRWIPEMMPAAEGYTIGQQFVVPETGDYLVTLAKADHSPSTNFEVTFTIQ
jgi:hypothetical protein